MFRRFLKRLFAFYVVCLLCFSFVMPMAMAKTMDGSGDSGSGSGGGSLINVDALNFELGDLWANLLDAANKGMYGWQNLFVGLFDEDVCQASEEYNSRHSFVKMHTTVDGKLGYYWICENCGKSAGEIAEEQYSGYVEGLPAAQIDDDGALYIKAQHECYYFEYAVTNEPSEYYYCEHGPSPSYYYTPGLSNFITNYPSYYFFNHDEDYIYFHAATNAQLSRFTIGARYSFDTSVSGIYTVVSGNLPVLRIFDKDDNLVSTCSVPVLFSGGFYDSGVHVVFDVPVDCNYDGDDSSTVRAKGYEIAQFPDFWFRVRPISGLLDVSDTDSDNVYNNSTRAGSIIGNYGIITSSGDVQQIDTQTIVNEGDHTVYNPVTNTTTDFSGWTYDYSDRSYNLVTSNGDMKVTYGDENITIQEGNTVYNVYYLVETPASTPTPTPLPTSTLTPIPTIAPTSTPMPTPVHVHDYTGSVIREATCTDVGSRLFTCSCGDSYTETIPALGHDWEVETRVYTDYGSDGQLVQEGYTIYRCSRCGEEYKDTSGQGLITTGGDNTLAIPGIDTLRGWYSGYVELMSDLCPFIPSEIIQLITWGMAAVVFRGVTKRYVWGA